MKEKAWIFKHPYAFEVEIRYGTFKEMMDHKQHGYFHDDKAGFVHIGGSFNEKMSDTKRASLVAIGVEIVSQYDPDNMEESKPEIKGVRFCHWEGTYSYSNLFDKAIEQGLYPVSVNWDGKTYIERWKDGETYYEQTDTYRY